MDFYIVSTQAPHFQSLWVSCLFCGQEEHKCPIYRLSDHGKSGQWVAGASCIWWKGWCWYSTLKKKIGQKTKINEVSTS